AGFLTWYSQTSLVNTSRGDDGAVHESASNLTDPTKHQEKSDMCLCNRDCCSLNQPIEQSLLERFICCGVLRMPLHGNHRDGRVDWFNRFNNAIFSSRHSSQAKAQT